ncbi:MAG: efflux RND transporter permease subunit [bacterium]
MFLSNVSIKRPVLMTMVIMSFVVIGLYSYLQLAVDLTPDVDFPIVTVTMVYPGAGPKEIETLIVEPIEEEVSTISGVKHVQAVAREGIAVIIVEFEIGTEVDIAAIDVKDKVDAIRADLPDDAEDPVISKFDINALPIIDLAISSPRPLEEVYRIADDVVKERLSRVSGVASVEILGGKEREILIAVNRDRLRAYGMSILEVVGGIAAANLDIPGGHIKEGIKEYTIRLEGEFDEVEQIRLVQLTLPHMQPIKLTEVAEVIDTFEEQRDLARYNNAPAVGMSVIKKGDANTVEVAKDVKKAINELTKVLPEDVKIEIARDRAIFIEQSVNDVMSNLLIGIFLTALVLYLFLHNLQGTVIAAIAMPTSIIATFMLILFAGFTLNFMSLMGLAISVGILVANSIVVLENIIRRVHLGEEPAVAADVGTAEIALAVIAATLTNIVVFTPIAFMAGIVGQFFKQFGLTVAFATLFSLLVSFTLTPMLASKLLKRESTGKDENKRRILNRFWGWWDGVYDEFALSYKNGLRWALNHRAMVFGGITFVFFGSLFLVRFVGTEFFTPSDEGQISISLEMPAGTRIEQTDLALQRVEEIVQQIPEVKSIYTVLGKIEAGGLAASTEGVEVGEMNVKLVDESKRDKTTREVVKELLPKLAVIPAADIGIKPTNPFGGGAQADLQIEISGDDMEVLNRLAEKIMDIVGATKGTTSIKSSWKVGKPEIKIVPDRERIASYGLTVGQLASAIRTSIEGTVASEYRVGDNEYDIRVRFADADKSSVDQARDIQIRGGNGYIIPITEVATIDFGEGPTQISRKDKKRLVTVTANIAQRTLGEVQGDIEAELQKLNIPPGYGIFFAGQSERQAESFANILQALILAIILTYMVLAAILESYIHPITIMMTLPLGLVGVILALLITKSSLSIFSMMALVMLVGIVVNNGILLLDYTNILRARGKGLEEAILEACSTRLRPIIMMNLAVALGMLPLALGIGKGAETRAPMAIVSIGGIITSTIFTLILIPLIYETFEKFKTHKLKDGHRDLSAA